MFLPFFDYSYIMYVEAPEGWGISYYDGDRLLTATGWRNQAYMYARESGQGYMVEQLSLGVGECVYGLGERFTPFVKADLLTRTETGVELSITQVS